MSADPEHPQMPMAKFPLWRIIPLPIVKEPRGNLTFVEGDRHVPFNIARVYYLYDVPGGASRAGHAHKKLHQFLIAASGSFDVLVENGKIRETLTLNRSYYGLYIPPMVWREIHNFSSGAVCIALASEYYDEADYIRDHDTFLAQATAR